MAGYNLIGFVFIFVKETFIWMDVLFFLLYAFVFLIVSGFYFVGIFSLRIWAFVFVLYVLDGLVNIFLF